MIHPFAADRKSVYSTVSQSVKTTTCVEQTRFGVWQISAGACDCGCVGHGCGCERGHAPVAGRGWHCGAPARGGGRDWGCAGRGCGSAAPGPDGGRGYGCGGRGPSVRGTYASGSRSASTAWQLPICAQILRLCSGYSTQRCASCQN